VIEGTWPPMAGPMGTPAARRRAPWSVVLASVLLGGGGLVALLTIIYFGIELAHVDELVDRAARVTEASAAETDPARTTLKAFDAIGIATCAVIGLSFLGLGYWSFRGSHVGRVLTCVAAGAATMCCCGSGGLSLVANSQQSQQSAFSTELARQQAESATFTGLLLLAALGLVPLASLGALVMLVLPPSNRYFRPPPPVAPILPTAPYYAYPDESYWAGPAQPPPAPPSPAPPSPAPPPPLPQPPQRPALPAAEAPPATGEERPDDRPPPDDRPSPDDNSPGGGHPPPPPPV
jgi:hypothetical protein